MKLITTAALVLATTSTAWADTPVTIDFEAATSFASVGSLYATTGVTFSSSAIALANDGTGSGVNGAFFTNAITPGTSDPFAGTVMFVNPTDLTAVMNVAPVSGYTGFVSAVSFDYANAMDAFNLVQVYAGLNGTGQRLAKISLSENQIDSGCTSSAYCNWQRVTLTFSGTAQSVVFASNSGGIAYDNIRITAVPELDTFVMLAAGLAAMAFIKRRQQG
jgi:hypothetical protein